VKQKRIAAIDAGFVKTGIAISDPLFILASPLPTFKMPQESLKLSLPIRLKQLVRGVAQTLFPYMPLGAVILGNPLLLNGKPSAMGEFVYTLCPLLQDALQCPVMLWDERLTSIQAERHLKEMGCNRKKRALLVDGQAACLLLQNYLDAKIPEDHSRLHHREFIHDSNISSSS